MVPSLESEDLNRRLTTALPAVSAERTVRRLPYVGQVLAIVVQRYGDIDGVCDGLDR